MCERCDQELAAIEQDEIEHDADDVAAIAAQILAQAIPATTHGVVIGLAVADAVSRIGIDMLVQLPDEHITPRMSEYAQRIAKLAAKKVITLYRGEADA